MSQNDTVNIGSEVDFKVGLFSRYVWRGIDLGASPSIQPEISYCIKNFEIGIWSAYATNGTYNELDLYFAYHYKWVSVGVTDYFNPDENIFSNQFFDYRDKSTKHILEFNLDFEGDETFPFLLSANTVFYGNDKKCTNKITVCGNDTTTQQRYTNLYSTYIEVGYKFNVKKVKVLCFAGMSPAESMYSEGFAFTNIGIKASRDLLISGKLSIPFQMSAIFNPDRENAFLVAGISF